MPFENFYKESFYDQVVRRWRIVSGLFFVVFIGFVVMHNDKPDEPPPLPKPETRQQAPVFSTERIKRVDELCSSLPVPEDFNFTGKSAPTETNRFVSVIHTFKSSRSKEEIYPTFIVWFGANGWADDKTPYEYLEFSKDKQTISIAPFSTKEGDYFGINCTEWKTE